jgi:hypothetical protein
MIRYITKFILALSLITLGGITASYAQMYSDTILKVKVPNSFVLRGKTYPAGVYTIKPADTFPDSEYMLELIGPDRKAAFFDTVGTAMNEPPKQNEIVFDKVGDTYFLSKIWVKGETNGNKIVESKMEKELITGGQP